jgi:prephenate dehydratase
MTPADPSLAGRRVRPRIAFLGPPGTFCEQALGRLDLARDAEPVAAPTIRQALVWVAERYVEYALVPLENSVVGPVAEGAWPPGLRAELTVESEVVIQVSFCLGARRGWPLRGIRSVASHRHALAQCARWMGAHLPEARFVAVESTAAAAAAVAAGLFDAAICAPHAVARFQLMALADRIEDTPGATTRFGLLARLPPQTLLR